LRQKPPQRYQRRSLSGLLLAVDAFVGPYELDEIAQFGGQFLDACECVHYVFLA
jgi:hypothetical protein